MRLSMRFDFRNPALAGTNMADRYEAAIEMAEWADGLGIPVSIAVSEHHGSLDGYIPSPALIIAAMAARTKGVRFSVAALIAPFHDPLRIAEDYCVLDNITRGRVDLIVAGGYAPSEFARPRAAGTAAPAASDRCISVNAGAGATRPWCGVKACRPPAGRW